MENYEIIKIRHSEYECIIFSQSYETPFSYLDKICDELKNYNLFNCKVVFDMLLNIGNTSERFAEARFDGECFIDSTFQYIKVDKKNELRKIATDFFKEKF
ncbi:Uncharacterised protein [Clostridium sporogenes]|uniref:type II toxin-antitoxin system RnlB family antitoxin n=1 Tax=Clostridium sporogenes TaxID=1509 RepID=UPI000D8F548C|nr:type II toxin-antitoxin system RnlB family antitoxin [Clostridium sporogenes]SQC40077.1 Uncharacterised protein [Clostridium sporogenes]